jgi:hypothetical protein
MKEPELASSVTTLLAGNFDVNAAWKGCQIRKLLKMEGIRSAVRGF